MGKVAKLICVAVDNPKSTSSNNNKYYNMVENGDGTFTSTWGRVGVTSDTKTYPISKWESTYKSKLRKGYKDISELCVIENETKKFVDISDAKIAKLISDLQSYTSQLVNKTYLIGADSVTMKQIEEAQILINDLIALLNVKDQQKFNNTIIHLYTIIPRKMKNVRDHIVHIWDDETINKMISSEQDNLDAMESQVKTLQMQHDNKSESLSILDALGIEIYHATYSEQKNIMDLMRESKNRFGKAYRVIKKSTENRFNKYVKAANNTKTSLLFHGSRNSNWFNIIQNGLLIKPANVVHAGSMFGNGIYFANKARKSIGYTSLEGSYWARGNERVAYMAVYDVHVGKSYIVKNKQYDYGNMTKEKITNLGYDSLHAFGRENGGSSLMNDEIIVYDISQSTIRFLIELK